MFAKGGATGFLDNKGFQFVSSTNSSVVRQAWGAVAAVVIAAAWHVTASGQSTITVTFPSVIAAGPDFATDVLRDPWDMNNIEDVSPDPGEIAGFTNFSVNSAGNGLAGGRTAINDAGVMFLSRGIYGTVTAHKNGFSFPIDTSSYQKLSVRLSDSGLGENPQVYWFPKQSGEASPEQFGVKYLPPTKNGNSILVTSLTTGSSGSPWTSAPMRGFRIDPNSDNSGFDMFFDWIRLTCADGTPCATMNTASWTGGSGNATVVVLDAGGTVLNVAPTATVSGTSLSWNTGILPPGNYTLRVTRGTAVGTKAFRINTPPTIAVTDPSRTSGPDFATTVLGNAWDMSASNDVAGSFNISPLTFSGGQLHGTNTNGDPALELLNNANNAGGARAINTSRYRYLTHRMQVDGPVDIANGSVTRIFWSSSPFAGGAEVTTTRDIVAFAGMRDYTIDLASLSVGVTGGLEPSGTMEPWTTNNKRYLRFDPHEFAAARQFHIDDVKLTAIPESFGTYTIRWAGADADGDATTVNLYLDNDRNPGNGKTTIVTGLPIAQASYVWDSSAVPQGTYYIYAEAFDGVNISATYSDAPIIRGTAPCVFTLAPTGASAPYAGGAGTVGVTTSASGCAWTATSNSSFITVTGGAAGTGNGTVSYGVARNPGRPARAGTITIAGQVFTINQAGAAALGDFNGDGRADYTAYNPGNGLWTSTSQAAVQFGLPGDIPVPGDYNGDAIGDRAVFRPSDGSWYIQGGYFQWGLVGDLPVPADYDGDGITDGAVFRRVNGSAGMWLIRNQPARSFGLYGDEPVPADYDGDGKADLAVYRPTTGGWYVALSSTGFASVTVLQWGLPGDVAVPGDFDGDHRADITVFRPSTGTWYILYSASNYSTSFALHWGVLGDVPLAADFSGDGFDDPTVFRASDATFWTYNPVSMLGSSQQQGKAGDIPAFQRPRRPVVPTTDFDGDLRSDVSVFRPSNGMWFIRHSYSDYVTTQSIQWGLPGDKAVPGDYDGDHMTDVAVWRPSNGTWYLKYSIGGFTNTAAFQLGLQGDIPVPADYDGDGRTDLAVFRPSDGNWFVLRSSSNYTTVFTPQLGLSGDVPVPADYDGDGKADVAVFRPASGQWFINRSTLGSYVRQWGLSSDVPIAGDFDRDGRADLTIFRPSTGQWLGIDPTTLNPTMNRQWGLNGDTPLAHDFDGDGATDTAVFRPQTAEWFIVLSSAPNGPTKYLQWGLGSSDQPLIRPGG